MLSRQTVIDTVNNMLSTVLNSEGYYHNPKLELTSDHEAHKIISEVQLLCGRRLIVEIFYEKNQVGSAVKIDENIRLSNNELLEMAKVAGIIERKLDRVSLSNVFESYKP